MIRIAHKREERLLKHLPAEVVAKALEIATILDENYGSTRDTKHDLGGYILIVETAEDVKAIRMQTDLEHTLPEYVDLITCENGYT